MRVPNPFHGYGAQLRAQGGALHLAGKVAAEPQTLRISKAIASYLVGTDVDQPSALWLPPVGYGGGREVEASH